MTDDASSTSRPAVPDETEASLRAILREQIAGAEADAQVNLDALLRAAAAGGDTGIVAEAQNNLAAIGRLQRRIDTASPATLTAMRAEVIALVAATQATTHQAQAAGGSGRSAEAALHAASEAARKTVSDFTRDFYERKVFDKFLRFTPDDPEEEYRKREADRQKAIEEAKALHTPEGDLRAARLAIAQLKDAGDHGADLSPDYKPTLDGLTAARDQLQTQVAAKGQAGGREARAAVLGPTASSDGIELPSDLLASIRASRVAVADQHAHGHGVSQSDPSGPPKGRG